MSSIALFELLAAIAAFAAAIFLADQQLHRPRPYKLLWTLGLFFYGVAAAAAFAGAAQHWTVTEYKLWYYFGGILTAAFLGLGSFWLLGPRRAAAVITMIASILALYAALRVVTVAVPSSLAGRIAASSTADVTNVGKFHVLPDDLTAVAIVMNIPGALFLFGGAAWSAYQFWRRHAPGYRLVSMLFLALGAVFPSILTGLQRLGYSGGAALGEFAGAVCLFVGLLISLDAFTVFRVPFTNVVLRERRPAPASGH
jgi:uncharacterized protein YqgC (DUF456 family)